MGAGALIGGKLLAMSHIQISVTAADPGSRYAARSLVATLRTMEVSPKLADADHYMLPEMAIALRMLAQEIEDRLPEPVSGAAIVLHPPEFIN